MWPFCRYSSWKPESHQLLCFADLPHVSVVIKGCLSARISWFSCFFTFPTVCCCPKSSPSTTPPYRAPRHTRLSTPPFFYPDILVSPLQSIRQNSSVSKTVNHLCCCVSNLPSTIPSPKLFQLNCSFHTSPAHNIAFCFHVFPSAILHA